MNNIPDTRLRDLWRRVNGPLSELNGPLIRYAALVQAEDVSSWQPIATWNTSRTDMVFFWIVPKTAAEAYVDSAGDPIFSAHAPHWMYGRYQTWSSLEKATHWHEPLEPPDAGE